MKKLNEGVKFTSKEKSLVDKYMDDFNVGVEFEFHLSNGQQSEAFSRDGSSFDIANLDIDELETTSPEEDFKEGLWGTTFNDINVIYHHDSTPYRFYDPDYETYYDSLDEFFHYDFTEKAGQFLSNLYNFSKDIEKSITLPMDSLLDDDEEFIELFNKKLKSLYSNTFESYDNSFYHIATPDIINFLGFQPDTFAIHMDDGEFDIENIRSTLGSFTKNMDKFLNSDYQEIDSNAEKITKKLDDILSNITDEEMVEFVINQHTATFYEIPSLELPDSVKRNLYDIKDEHANQVEVITNHTDPESALYLIDDMFSFIKQEGSTSDSSGMHISISTNNDYRSVDLLKFLVLMEAGHIIEEVFPERQYVENISNILTNKIKTLMWNMALFGDINYQSSNNDIIKIISDKVLQSDVFKDKYQSIKFGDYKYLNGRIEMRFFGGADYEYRYDEIQNHLYRALYILMISSTKEFDKVYKKELYKIIFETIQSKCKEVLLGFELAKLYVAGKIKTPDDYKRFMKIKKNKYAGYRIDFAEVGDFAMVDGETVAEIIADTKHTLTDKEWEQLDALVGDMKKERGR